MSNSGLVNTLFFDTKFGINAPAYLSSELHNLSKTDQFYIGKTPGPKEIYDGLEQVRIIMAMMELQIGFNTIKYFNELFTKKDIHSK
jgi:hypothetical protein